MSIDAAIKHQIQIIEAELSYLKDIPIRLGKIEKLIESGFTLKCLVQNLNEMIEDKRKGKDDLYNMQKY